MTTSLTQYQKLTDIEHVLKRPGRYLGAVNDHTAETWYFDGTKMVFGELTWNPALIKMFDEVISNSVDHSKRPEGKKLNSISITLEDDKFIVEDNGGIPVQIHPDYAQYVPEMIFAELRSGSNFDDEQENTLTGQNGEGASLTNIFSTYFKLETADGSKKYTQEFRNNLSIRTEPRIVNSGNGFTRITWIPDYERLNTSLSMDNELKIIKRIHDIAATNHHLKITLNGERIRYSSFKDYISKYMDDFIFCSNADWKVGIAKSPTDGFTQVSFVNCGETYMGGTHIDYIVEPIVKQIREFIRKKHKIEVKPAIIRNQMMVFIDASIVNPRYNSQTKEFLITEDKEYKTSFVVPDKAIKQILESEVIASILDWVNARKREQELAELRKRQKANRNKKVATHINANSRKREKCCLYIAEGQSALNKWIDVRDRDYHGAFPLKGKPLNVRDMSPAEIVANVEIGNIMSILGLEFGKEAKNLNYGFIRIMTDADVDGFGAITSLLINFFSYWPELFANGIIEIVRTPIVVATQRKTGRIERYYELSDFDAAKLDSDKWLIEYMKGLGSLSDADYDLIINDPILETVRLTDPEILTMAFGPDSAPRKEWLLGE